MRRRLDISQAVVEVDGGRLAWNSPKNHERRSVPIPRFLVDELAAHLHTHGPDDLVFTAAIGGVLRNKNARRDWFNSAVAAISETGFVPHELRHTAASLAVSAGGNVKAVQRMLGHASAAMTLDRYADLFDDDLDAVADHLDAIYRRNVEATKTVAVADIGAGTLEFQSDMTRTPTKMQQAVRCYARHGVPAGKWR